MISTVYKKEVSRVRLEEYFEYEFVAEHRNEYINGQIIPMAYASDNHGLIAHNIGREIGNAVKGENIRVYQGDRMVFSPFCHEAYYPDVVVVVGQPEWYDYKGKMKSTLNPAVLIEVLSDSTEGKERGDKWPCYREMKSLRQYIMVSQHEPSIEFYSRQNETERWAHGMVEGLDAAVLVLGREILLKEIYALVDWEHVEV